MIAWSEAGIRNSGMTPESVAAVLALTETEDDAQQRWERALEQATTEHVTAAAAEIFYSKAAIDRYAEQAKSMGVRPLTSVRPRRQRRATLTRPARVGLLQRPGRARQGALGQRG